MPVLVTPADRGSLLWLPFLVNQAPAPQLSTVRMVAERTNQLNNNVPTSYTASITGVATGNHLLIDLGIKTVASGTAFMSTITDDQSNTYQQDLALAGDTTNRGVEMWSSKIAAVGTGGALTLTFTVGGTQTSWRTRVAEYAGLATSSWFDVGVTNVQTSGQTVTPTAQTPAGVGEVARCATCSAAELSFTTDLNYVQQGAPGNTAPDLCVQYNLYAGASSQAPTGTMSAGAQHTNAFAFYKAQPAASVQYNEPISTAGRVEICANTIDDQLIDSYAVISTALSSAYDPGTFAAEIYYFHYC